MNDGHRPDGPAYQPGPHIHVCAGVSLPEQHTDESCVCACGAQFTPKPSRTASA